MASEVVQVVNRQQQRRQGYLVPPLYEGPVTRCCEPARLLSRAPQRRCPESSFCERPAPNQLLASARAAGPGLVQHHQTADSARERMGRESGPAPQAHPPPGCCATAAPGIPRPGDRRRPAARAAAFGAASSQARIEQRPGLASPAPVPAVPLTLAAPRCSGGGGGVANTRWLGNPLPAPPPPAPARRAAPRAQEL